MTQKELELEIGREQDDFTGEDLSGLDLHGLDLRGKTFRHANLSHANLARADLSGSDLSNANLSGANLNHANLSDAILTEANLQNANLSGAHMEMAWLEDTRMENANLRWAILSGANLNGAILTNANVEYANLVHANLRKTILKGVNLDEAILENEPIEDSKPRRKSDSDRLSLRELAFALIDYAFENEENYSSNYDHGTWEDLYGLVIPVQVIPKWKKFTDDEFERVADIIENNGKVMSVEYDKDNKEFSIITRTDTWQDSKPRKSHDSKPRYKTFIVKANSYQDAVEKVKRKLKK